jgi:hypothetical protein
MPDKTNTCVRCGDEYESYCVFIKDSVRDIQGTVTTKSEWNLHEDGNDGLCKPCRMAVTDHGAYLNESEREELEPKHEVD